MDGHDGGGGSRATVGLCEDYPVNLTASTKA
jgi:hypothetical protein